MIRSDVFGTLPDGRDVRLFNMTNASGLSVSVMEFGGTITQMILPDRDGTLEDVALGYDDFEGYFHCPSQFNTLIGRHALRISNASYSWKGRTYHLERNEGQNHLHGGSVGGFHKQLWKGETLSLPDRDIVSMTYLSPDGQAGYPGNLKVRVDFTLTDTNSLIMDYQAIPEKDSPVNLMLHPYINLKGAGRGSIEQHKMESAAGSFTENDDDFLPTGRIIPVDNTPMDFRKAKDIGRDMDSGYYQQIRINGGYVAYYILPESEGCQAAARIEDPDSGRVLEIITDRPGFCFYTAEHLDGSLIGKDNRAYDKRGAFCIEPMEYPDNLNREEFPSSIVPAGEIYHQRTEYRFTTTLSP